NAAQATYLPPNGLGLWIPPPPQVRRALQPAWGTMRTFVLADSDEAAPPAPPPFSTDTASPFYAYAREVYDAVVDATPEQKDIAFFWADDPGPTSTPPGHWVNIVSLLAVDDDLTLTVAAEAYARVGLAVGDAFIGCWRAKYVHNVIRPISYIQTYLDDQWTSLVGTPPFPTYTSGHSTVSGAAATVLAGLFGTRRFTDWTHTPRGIPPRFFDSFEDAAQEAADSRLYGGIHYRFDNEEGLFHGQRIGQLIHERVTFRN
ncbi:MAG: vanadium-dependent haloperoxidase, partial [Planctomycetota bacterium]